VVDIDDLRSSHARELEHFGDPPRFNIRMFPLLGMDSRSGPVILRADTSELRDVVTAIGMQFKRELRYDVPPFDPDDPHTEAFVIASTRFEATFPIAAGAGGMDRDPSGAWVLTWVWLHPYERGGRLFGDAWRALEARYGDFSLEGPFSPAMQRFIVGNGISADRLLQADGFDPGEGRHPDESD